MATFTKETIGQLHEKLTVKLEKTDYLPAFEKTLKEYGRKAAIPGFRKGLVPTGVIKKMYGPSLFTDEVLRAVDRELISYLQKDQAEIFGQPLPLAADLQQLDFNNPAEYTFHFEVGLKPSFALPDLGKAAVTRYVVTVTDDMIDREVTRLQNRYGTVKDLDAVSSEEDILNLQFQETDAAGEILEGGAAKDNSILVSYFAPGFRAQWMGKKAGDAVVTTLPDAFEEKECEWIAGDLGLDKDDPASATRTFRITLTKAGLLEKRELDAAFFEQLYPGQEVTTEAQFRGKIREEIQAHWNGQSLNQIHDQLYHLLIDQTAIEFPAEFLKKWLQSQGETPRTAEEAEAELPRFLSGLKWTLITEKIVQENAIEVQPEEIRLFAKQQLFGYLGGAGMADDQPWVNDYVEKMMKDRKYVEDAYNRLQTQKVFEWATTRLNPADKDISAEDFTKMVEEHQHHHH